MRKLAAILSLAICACNPSQMEEPDNFDWEGHRGARGNYPENTTPAFFFALDHGMNTLEMDVVISADSQVVVSHEPFFNEEICTIDSLKRDSLPNNLYKLTYTQISGIDCGSLGNTRFPDQSKMAIAKPLLKDVIEATEEYALQTQRSLPFYNIEIKSRPEWDGEFHPSVAVYAELLMKVATEAEIEYRLTVQSFDDRPLQYIHQKYPDVTLALLVQDSVSAEKHLTQLAFIPNIYSCYYLLVDEALVSFCKEKGMKLIPWTVNDPIEIKRLKALGIDGVITDYPGLKMQTIKYLKRVD